MRKGTFCLLLGCLFALLPSWVTAAPQAPTGQPSNAGNQSSPDAGVSEQDLQQLAAEAARGVDPAPANELGQGSINFLNLLIEGGTLMVPIAIMSLLVVTVALERFFSLRRTCIFPRQLRREIRRAREESGSAMPQTLYEASQQYPSAGARILEDVLQKIGRPVPEIETVISEGTQREADHLYGNVRWLTLAAAVTPLIGLLGTVWGMIIAFYNTTQLGAGTNKAEFLAEGIYVALVTTLGGLAVAIPAAIFAHFFEGRITKLLAQVDKELRALVPRFEAMEGKARYDIDAQGLTRRVLPEKSNHRRPTSGSSTSRQSAPQA